MIKVRFRGPHDKEPKTMPLREFLAWALSSASADYRYHNQIAREIRLLTVLVEKRTLNATELCTVIYGEQSVEYTGMQLIFDEEDGKPIERAPDLILTVGQVARVCQVAPKTVQTWCDREMITHYRIGKGGDRRINKKDLDKFAAAFNIPIDMSLLEVKRKG